MFCIACVPKYLQDNLQMNHLLFQSKTSKYNQNGSTNDDHRNSNDNKTTKGKKENLLNYCRNNDGNSICIWIFHQMFIIIHLTSSPHTMRAHIFIFLLQACNTFSIRMNESIVLHGARRLKTKWKEDVCIAHAKRPYPLKWWCNFYLVQ